MAQVTDIQSLRDALHRESGCVLVLVTAEGQQQWDVTDLAPQKGLTTVANCDELKVVQLCVDHGEPAQAAATEFNMTAPSAHFFRNGTKLADVTGATATPDSIQAMVSEAISTEIPEDVDEAREGIRNAYAAVATGAGGCCGTDRPDSLLLGYSPAELAKAAAGDVGQGCGNPLSFANLQLGEVVVDLGSGGGLDCMIAGTQVGPTGSAIGVDMTPEMLARARTSAKDAGHTNVHFRLGEIEHLPIPDNSVDCVISNCVINLSSDKQQVLKEIWRVLKPGGRVAIADVVTREAAMPEHLRTAEALAC